MEDSTKPGTSLDYIDSDGTKRTVRDCNMYVDKHGRYWLWSERLKHNLSYRARSREACLLNAIDSLLFTVQLRDERIAELKRVADLAQKFIDDVNQQEK